MKDLPLLLLATAALLDTASAPAREVHPGAVTGAAIACMTPGIPTSCTTAMAGGVTSSHCGGAWYLPQMQGGCVVSVIVAPPA